ncbi:MAG: TonB-dependent receptor [Bryobacteraceae bacterium]
MFRTKLTVTRKLILAVLIAVAGVLLPTATNAQVSTAALNGTVTDSTGAIVPEAALILRNTQTGVETRTTTNAQGVYVILNILPGKYVLEAGKQGFSSSRMEEFALVVNQRSVFDFHLEVGKVQEAVTVEAVGAQLQSATAELGSVLTRQQVVDLPLGRNIQNMMRLTPGVTAIGTGQSSIPSVNGQINRSSMYMLDGVNNQATFFSNLALNPIIETIEEFKVQSHNDSAEVGGVMGGIINTTTKSGTNELHGNVYSIEQNDAFNARNTFLASVAPFKGHTFGGTAGGPLIIPKVYNGKNKTFFFGGYQRFYSVGPAQSTLRVPTPANLQGDMSDWPQQIYDPFSTRANPDGTFVRDPFSGNRIPASRLNPGMVYFAQTVLPPIEPTGIANQNAWNRTRVQTWQHSINGRVDHRFSDKDAIWVRYSGYFNPGKGAASLPSQGRVSDGRAHNLAANWVRTFGPTAVFQYQFGRVFQWSGSTDHYKSIPSDFATKVGYSANVITPYQDGNTYFPGFNPAGFFSSQEQWNVSRTGDSWHHRSSYSKLVGSHMFKFGAEYNRVQWYYENGVTSIGFANQGTADPLRIGNTGSPLASFLLNVPDSATRRDIIETMPWWGGTIGFYAQDSWKATNRLTVNLGLRYDRTFIPTAGTADRNNNFAGNMDFLSGTYILQVPAPPCGAGNQKGGCIPTPAGAPAGWLPDHVVVAEGGKVWHDTKLNFMPRLGLAYRLGSKTVLRVSSGVFFDNFSGITQLARNFIGTYPALGWQSAANLNYASAGQLTPNTSGLNPLPSATLPVSNPFSQSTYSGDPNWKNAYSIQWNGGFQHQLTREFLLSVNYVGSGTRRTTIGGRYGGAMTPGPGRWQDRAPFPYMISPPSSFDRSWGTANYHGLQTSFERRWSSGMAFTAAYTWSKAIDAGSSGFFGVEGNSIQNPYNMRPDRSVSSYDVPHNLVLSWVYDLPFGKGKALQSSSRAVNLIIGGWQVNGLADIRSGQPVNLTIAGDISNTGGNAMRPNVVGDWRVDNSTPARWFAKEAFAAPAAFTFGNAGRNVLRTDGVHRVDMSAFRNFHFKERFMAQLRVEGYNVLNVVTYGAPTAEFTNVNFGRVTSAQAPRSLQIGARIYF